MYTMRDVKPGRSPTSRVQHLTPWVQDLVDQARERQSQLDRLRQQREAAASGQAAVPPPPPTVPTVSAVPDLQATTPPPPPPRAPARTSPLPPARRPTLPRLPARTAGARVTRWPWSAAAMRRARGGATVGGRGALVPRQVATEGAGWTPGARFWGSAAGARSRSAAPESGSAADAGGSQLPRPLLGRHWHRMALCTRAPPLPRGPPASSAPTACDATALPASWWMARVCAPCSVSSCCWARPQPYSMAAARFATFLVSRHAQAGSGRTRFHLFPDIYAGRDWLP